MPLFIKRSLLIIICLFVTGTKLAGCYLAAAETVTQAQWHKLTNDKAFNYVDDLESATRPVENTDSGLLLRVLQAIYSFFMGAKFLLWPIVICGILFVIYKIFVNSGSFMFSKNKKVMGESEPMQAGEEAIDATNWEALLQKALSSQDLRLAVRYRYMWLLQILQRNEQIQYSSDKTNCEYYTELKEAKYKQTFRQLSRQYEYVWYGNFSMSPDAFAEYGQVFDNIRKQLGA